MSVRALLLLALLTVQLAFAAPAPVALNAVDAWFVAANAAYEKADFKEAVRLYRLSIQNGERPVFAWYNMGNALVRLGKPSLARVAYRRSVELAPEFYRPWVQLGDLSYLAQEWGEAAAAYTRALELDAPQTYHIHRAMGQLALATGAWTDAQFHFEACLKEDPDRVEIWFALSEAAEKLGDLESAEKTLREALVRAPSSGAETYFALAALLEKQGKALEARRAVEDGLSLDPSRTDERRWLARSHVAGGTPWMAIFVLEEGLLRNPGDLELRLELANTLFAQSRWDESLDHYRRAAAQGSASARLGIQNVANSFWNEGDTLKARLIFER